MQQVGLYMDLIVTGTGAINQAGVRFGKSHCFLDLEWAMLTNIGVVHRSLPCIAVVHDRQVLAEELKPEVFDTVFEHIVTPTRVVQIEGPVRRPTCEILRDKLQPGMLENIPQLQEMQRTQTRS